MRAVVPEPVPLRDPLKWPPGLLVVTDTDCLSAPIDLPMLAVLPELIRPLTLVLGLLAPVEAGLLFALMELPIRTLDLLLKLEPDSLPALGDDGARAPIEAPMRPVLLELNRPLALAGGLLAPVEAGVLGVLIELPIRKLELLLKPEPDCLPELGDDGKRAPIEAPMRPVLLALSRPVELPLLVGTLLEIVPVGLRLAEELDEGVRMLSPTPDRELLILLDVELLGGRLVGVLLGKLKLDLDEILELLRLEDGKRLELLIDRLDRDDEPKLLRLLILLRLLMLLRLLLGDRLIVGAERLLAADDLLRLLTLDLELLDRLLLAITGSAKTIKAETSITSAVLARRWYFAVNMICLLSSFLAIIQESAIVLPNRGTNSRSSNEFSHQNTISC